MGAGFPQILRKYAVDLAANSWHPACDPGYRRKLVL